MRKRARAAIAAAATTTAITAQLLGGVAAHAAPKQPDLVVTAVTVVGTATAGQPTTFKATIENQGTGATPAGVIHGVGFQVDGVLRTWSDTRTASLAPGQSVTLTANSGPTGSASWIASAGQHELLAFVDDAKRIAESDEGNNRTKKTITVAASRIVSSTMVGDTPVTTLVPLAQATGLSSYVVGATYAACVSSDGSGHGVIRPGTETYVGDYSAGSVSYHQNAPFSWSGVGDAPVGARTVTSSVIDPHEIVKYHYGTPAQHLSCLNGESAQFTRLHATEITTNQYAIAADGWSSGALLSTFTGPVSAHLYF